MLSGSVLWMSNECQLLLNKPEEARSLLNVAKKDLPGIFVGKAAATLAEPQVVRCQFWMAEAPRINGSSQRNLEFSRSGLLRFSS